jgi:hypothetical protein
MLFLEAAVNSAIYRTDRGSRELTRGRTSAVFPSRPIRAGRPERKLRPSGVMPDKLIIVALVFAALSVGFLIGGVAAARKRRFMGSAFGIVLTLLFLALSALFATISISTQGYRALTREEVAATVVVDRLAPTRFSAEFTFADGRTQSFTLAGDEFYVDAHILKWKPLANVLGLHTAYELDRVAGRYTKVEDEQSMRRTVYPLAEEKALDMYDLRARFPLFKPLVDTEYGSATFIAVQDRAEFEVRVSTTGLLIRKVEGT